MQRVGLIGDPVAHSRSPRMHQAAFAALGLDARYELWPTTLAELPARIASLRAPDVLGANVTIPHKRAVIALLDDLAPMAQLVGAVNTIVRQGGRLIGDNTDAHGLAAALRLVGWEEVEQGVVLGSGGAARAAIIALHRLGARMVCVMARNGEAAQHIVDTLAPHVPGTSLLWGDLNATEPGVWQRMLAGTEIVVNATSVGMNGVTAMPLSVGTLDQLRAGTLVVDVITAPTALARAAQARELPCMDGLPMLLHQGAQAFTLWTGHPAPLAAMRAALMESIPDAIAR